LASVTVEGKVKVYPGHHIERSVFELKLT